MRRCSSISSPLASFALLLLLCIFNCAAAARLLHAVPADPLVVDHEDGVKAAAAAAVDGLVLENGATTVINGDDLPVSLESEMMMGADEEPEPEAACEDDDECMQRRLLNDAHLDYIYTQHKGSKP